MAEEKPTLAELGGDYCEDTERWFEAWRASPRTDGWDAPQWQYMKDCAVVHDMVYGQSDLTLMPELQKRLEFLGLAFAKGAPRAQRADVAKRGEILRLVTSDRERKAAAV